MARPPTWLLALVAATVIVGGGALAVSSGVFADDSYEWTTVTVVDSDTDAELATVDARIADTPKKRFTGLSNTSSLGPNEGMLFIHGTEGQQSYVMRGMSFPIDIVFINADGEIMTIHHADVDTYGPYPGTGKYVLELPHNYTTDNDIAVGDRVEIPAEYR
ncbi:DUF192 domain-containing protein [Halonotius terrestris]|uniref:DUF192 domain-containing protein n=1 Tax=Halonotius terrestris TaxID=2487750 RepID=A0A8J8PA44_9EURY|nr:DUF192 domain-containing protein [Halonotius terrestris]TQQ81331.1 DUF192 domain-containing protein [Halonotius terrestris]